MNFMIPHRFHNFSVSAPAPVEVPLEVQMRFEQVIIAVTRPVVVATVREIKVVVSFVSELTLHLCQQRKTLGMPAYSSGSFMSPMDDMGRQSAEMAGGQRGRLRLEPIWADATCSTGTRNA